MIKTVKKSEVKAEEEIDETTTLKDLDLNFVFRMQRFWYKDLLRQIECDCEFLEAERIMDYSLLVGVHFCDGPPVEKMGMSPFAPSIRRRVKMPSSTHTQDLLMALQRI